MINLTGSAALTEKSDSLASVNVSLTHLRGLEIAELTKENMPVK